MQKFDTPAPIAAVLNIPAGRVRFIAADRADTAVEVLPADASKGRDVKAAEQTKVEYTDGVLRIRGMDPHRDGPAIRGRLGVCPQLDNLDLEALSTACAAEGRYEFLLVVAPLNVPGGTGSPVNPVAVL
jgi:hypothetical protein